MIARSAAYQIKYYVLAVSEWFSHGLGGKPTLVPASCASEDVRLRLPADLCRGPECKESAQGGSLSREGISGNVRLDLLVQCVPSI